VLLAEAFSFEKKVILGYNLYPAMMDLPDDEIGLLKKRNRVKKLSPKKHKIAHEAGGSLKVLYRQIVERRKRKN
jgi:hypothetical protein